MLLLEKAYEKETRGMDFFLLVHVRFFIIPGLIVSPTQFNPFYPFFFLHRI